MSVDTSTWPRTSRRGYKIVCPDCGLTGYVGGRWIERHDEHVRCDCGAVTTKKGWKKHASSKFQHTGVECTGYSDYEGSTT